MANTTLGKIIHESAAKPWMTIGIWILLLVGAVFYIQAHMSSALTTEQTFTSQPDSKTAVELIDEHFPASSGGSELVIIHSHDKTTFETPGFATFTKQIVEKLRSTDHVVRVDDFYQIGDPSLVSQDKTALLIPVTLESGDREMFVKAVVKVAKEARNDKFDVRVTGDATISQNFSEVSEHDLRISEIYGLPLTLVILVFVFGAVVAALIPMLLSLISIIAAVGLTAFVGTEFAPVSFFVVNMITMMGLAVGIDYSLFIISRFREERLLGKSVFDAIDAAGDTAGRAVLFSGLTVVLALCGLYLVPMNIFQGLATGAIFVVIFAVLSALTLLPAALGLLGDRINWLRIGKPRTQVDTRGGFWDGLTKRIMARPVASLLLAVAFLLLLALPTLDLRIGASGISSMPDYLEARQAYNLLRDEFSVGLLSPAVAVVDGDITTPSVRASVDAFQQRLMADADFGPSQVTPSPDGRIATVSFHINADSTSEKAQTLVGRIRQEIVPATFSESGTKVYLSGEAANNADFIGLARDNAPRVFLFVLGLSFLLLMMVFRSIVVPLKAILMNLLSVASAYGLLVLVFQKGIGNEIFGFGQVEKIEAWLPLFLFCVLFGLSMDYHVFLLSRIREHFTKTGDNTESVAFGVRTTASLITGAALIMVVVFGSFAAGDLVMFQQMGFGLGVAILLDATVVRSFLVPASMRLLGERNWYLPPFLRWLPNISVEGPVPNEAKAKPRIR